MVTDSLFYRLFKTSPEIFFLALGMPTPAAREMASRYRFDAIEFKETSHRSDGAFLPNESGQPIYFVEVQFYCKPSIFADLLVKVFTFLKQNDPTQQFCGVVLFANRSLEPIDLGPYQSLIGSGQLRRFYLDEMAQAADAPLGLSILYLIQKPEDEAAAAARELIVRTRAEVGDEALQHDLIELIETVIFYKLIHLTREEIQAMLQVHDIRQSRVFQEAKQEGKQEGIEEGIAVAVAVTRLAAQGTPAEEIAAKLKVDPALVKRVLSFGSSS